MRLFNPFLSTSHDALAFANCWVSSWEPCRSCRNSPLRSCSAILRSARVLLTALVYRRTQETPPVIMCRGRRVHSYSNIKRGKSKVWRKLAIFNRLCINYCCPRVQKVRIGRRAVRLGRLRLPWWWGWMVVHLRRPFCRPGGQGLSGSPLLTIGKGPSGCSSKETTRRMVSFF